MGDCQINSRLPSETWAPSLNGGIASRTSVEESDSVRSMGDKGLSTPTSVFDNNDGAIIGGPRRAFFGG
jgi:hypothetical protein